MFTLLDALQTSGHMPLLIEARWRELKARIDAPSTYETEATALYELLHDAEATGVLAGTWMETRWHAVKARLGCKG